MKSPVVLIFGVMLCCHLPSYANDSIQEYTKGDCSPIVHGINGNATINCFFDRVEREWSFDFSVFVSPKVRKGEVFIESDKLIKYSVIEKNNTLYVLPSIENLEYCDNIYPRLKYPTLDIKVVNNNKKSIVIDKVILNVEDSVFDTSPFICIEAPQPASIGFKNIGYGNVRNFELKYNITHSEKYVNFGSHYDYTQKLSSFDKSDYSFEKKDISIRDSLISSGVPMNNITEKERNLYTYIFDCNKYNEKMEKVSSCDKKRLQDFNSMLDKLNLGLFRPKSPPYVIKRKNTEGYFEESHNTATAILYGQISYDKYDFISQKVEKKQFNFTTEIPFLLITEYGGELEVSANYDAKLKDQGNNYQVIIPVSHHLKDGEADRFTVKLGVDKSSYHKFTIELVTTSGLKLRSKSIGLYIPKMW